MNKLRAINFFLCVCQYNNFTNASKILGTSASSISRTISRLEHELKFKLFERSSKSLYLTSKGKVYYKQIRNITESLENIESSLYLENNSTHGVIHINSPFDYGHSHVQPFLKLFAKEYPDIQIELRLDDNHINVANNKADLLIRTGVIEDSAMIVRKLSPMDFILCASPKYLQKIPGPITTDTIIDYSWIRFRLKTSGKLAPITIINNGLITTLNPKAHYITNYGQVEVRMGIDGLGFIHIPHFLAKKWLDNGQLVSLFSAYCPPTYGVYILYGERKYLPKRVRVFIDSFSQYVQSLGEFPEYTWAQNLK